METQHSEEELSVFLYLLSLPEKFHIAGLNPFLK